jgi:predicted Zn-dependent peptidase
MYFKRIQIFLLITLLVIGAQHLCFAQTFEKMKGSVKEFTLKNGMKFIVLERHDAPVVSFHVYADVGSANETLGITGISHLLEHMAFKGTKVVGTKDYETELKIFAQMDELYEKINRENYKADPDTALIADYRKKFESLRTEAKKLVINNDHWDMMRGEGDAWGNASTRFDATEYYNSLPSNKLEFWMAMTSDRFLNPVNREFYKEKDVVMEERRLQGKNRPIGRLLEDFIAAAFKAHPYHHHVGGHMSDLKKITRKDVVDYFKKYYSPSNLTVGIVGDVKFKEVKKFAQTYFGRIPSGPKPEPIRTTEPEQWGERHVKVVAKSQPMLLAGYHCPSINHEDNTPLDALSNIISQGRSSRLYTKLIKEEKIAAQIDGGNGFPGTKYPNLIIFFVVASRGHTSEECMKQIDEEIEKIKKESVTPDELKKFKRSTIKGLIDGMESNSSMASQLTFYDVIRGDWRFLFDQIITVEALTVEDVKRVANKYLKINNRTIAEIIPEK